MNNRKKTVVLFLDGFSYSYINENDTPFLFRQSVRPLQPVFGFRQLAVAFGSPSPFMSGFFSDYYFAPDNSINKYFRTMPKPLVKLLEHIPHPALNIFLKRVLKKDTLARIPIGMAGYFGYEERAYPAEALLIKLLTREEKKHRFVLYPEVKSDEQAWHMLTALIHQEALPEFLLLHFPSLDPAGHRYGTNGISVKKLVRQFDNYLEQAWTMLTERANIVIFSDHGMVDVAGNIDVFKIACSIARPGRDFTCMLDSTMARFWTLRTGVAGTLKKALQEEKHSSIFIAKRPELRHYFGDFLFAANPGHIVFPNYFDKQPPLGMHGYLPPQDIRSSLNGILLAPSVTGLNLPPSPSMHDVYRVLRKVVKET